MLPEEYLFAAAPSPGPTRRPRRPSPALVHLAQKVSSAKRIVPLAFAMAYLLSILLYSMGRLCDSIRSKRRGLCYPNNLGSTSFLVGRSLGIWFKVR